MKPPKLLKFGFLTGIAVLFLAKVQAQSCSGPGNPGDPISATCFVQYQTSDGYLSKCGFPELTNGPDAPRFHYYHNQTTSVSHGYNYNWSFSGSGTGFSSGTGDGNSGYQQNISDGSLSGSRSHSANYTEYEHETGPFCTYSNSFSGSQSESDSGTDSRTNNTVNENSGGPTCVVLETDYSYSYNDSGSVVYVPGAPGDWGVADNNTTIVGGTCLEQTCGGCTGNSTNAAATTNSLPGTYLNMGTDCNTEGILQQQTVAYEQYDLSCTNTMNLISWGEMSNYVASTYVDTGLGTITLDTEYTDQELYNNIVNTRILPFSGSWYTPNGNSDYFLSMCAYSAIDPDYCYGDETELQNTDGDAELQEMEYRFAVPGSDAGYKYTIRWDLITWDSDGNLTTASQSTMVEGTGDPNNPAYSGIFYVAAPFWDEGGYGGYVFTWVDNVTITAQKMSPGSATPPGSGPVSSGLSLTGGGSCSSCGGGANGYNEFGSFGATFSMGNETNGYPVDPLHILASVAGPSLATPAALTCNTNDPDVQVIVTSNGIRQVYAPQGLADVVTNDPFSYEINYYLPSQVGSMVTGVYQLSGSPYVTWTIQNPNQTTNDDVLEITEARGSQIQNYTWTYATNSSGYSWTLDYPGGLREDAWTAATTTSTNEYGDSVYSRAITYTIGVPNGPIQYEHQRVYQFDGIITPNEYGVEKLDWGSEQLVQETVGSPANPQTTTYSYDDNDYSPNSTFKPLQLVVHPDGSWQYYDYYPYTPSYNEYGIPVLSDTYSGLGDEPAPASGSGPDPSQCRHTLYGYNSAENPPDDLTVNTNSPRTITRYSKGEPISVTYRVYSPGEEQEIGMLIGDGFDPTHALITTTMYYTSGPNSNRVQSVLNPDGTTQIYDYAQAGDGSQTNTIFSGEPNAGQTAIVDGTKDVTVLGPLGQMVSHTVTDIASGVALVQDTYSDYDQFDRPQQVTHLDGTTESMQYSPCCGTLESTTDNNGMTTAYLYDQANRQVGYQDIYGTSAVTYSNVLDAVGHVIGSYRIGSDDSVIQLSQSEYNTANQLVSQANALAGATTYSQTTDPNTGAQIDITVNPDGGTITNAYYLDGTLKKTSGTAVHGRAYGYGVETQSYPNFDWQYTVETNLNNDGSLSSEWTETFNDNFGRPVETLYADGSSSESFYNSLGQLAAEVDPDGVTNLYAYDAKGEQTLTAVDMNGNGQIDFAGNDRITETTNDVTIDHGTAVNRARTYAWTQNGADSPALISSTETSANGLDSWQTSFRDANTPVTTETQTSYGTGGARTTTATAPDGSYTVNTYSYGRLASTTRYMSSGTQISGATYTYDPQGRQYQVTDARNGATTYGYNNADLITTVTTPNPGNGPETTTTYYNSMLQATNVVQPDGTSVYSTYLLTGELGLQYGSRTYPVAYGYDYAGRMQTMTNWSNFSGNSGSRVTTWNYDPERGFLTSKAYDSGAPGPNYTYTSAGRLKTRTWARGVTTTYSYDNGGTLTGVSYSDSTPSIAYTLDRQGRQSAVTQNSMTDALAYNLANQIVSESFSGGILSGLSVTNGYDADLRRTSLTALSSGSPLFSTTYGYDGASRLSSVSDGGGNSAAYSYIANSPIVGQITFEQNSATRMTTTKQYDNLNRLTQISSVPTAAYTAPATFNYQYNSANQRIQDTLADGSYWVYGYDSLGQVTNGMKYFSDGTLVPGQEFGYAFDTIGNRTQTQRDRNQYGENLQVANYSANNLNQITSRDVPGYVDVLGESYATNVVTVNGQSPYRHAEYFASELPVNNSASPLWTNIQVSASVGGSVSGHAYVPQEPEHFNYDADGNLTNDGRWSYVWDGENRLIQMTVNTNVGPQYQLNFAYDYQGRRIQKAVAISGVGDYTNNFLYDGWNLVATLNPQSSILASYVWGSDLSGSQQGAGGVGGLLEVIDYGSATNFVAYDGNGNVSALVNVANGNLAANYEYGPFGELIRQTGPMATANPFRFSTKYDDDESDLLYYGYRYYKPSTGTWMSRDPSEEENGFNLYDFANNDPANSFDVLGLKWFVDREGSATAGATPDKGDTIAELAKIIGLDANEYQRWLTVPEGNTMPASVDQPMSGCEYFEVPNTVVAYWAGNLGWFGRWYVRWNSSVRYLRSLGFEVDDHHHQRGDTWGLMKMFIPSSLLKKRGIEAEKIS